MKKQNLKKEDLDTILELAYPILVEKVNEELLVTSKNIVESLFVGCMNYEIFNNINIDKLLSKENYVYMCNCLLKEIQNDFYIIEKEEIQKEYTNYFKNHKYIRKY